jgi:hypothetical protein
VILTSPQKISLYRNSDTNLLHNTSLYPDLISTNNCPDRIREALNYLISVGHLELAYRTPKASNKKRYRKAVQLTLPNTILLEKLTVTQPVWM